MTWIKILLAFFRQNPYSVKYSLTTLGHSLTYIKTKEFRTYAHDTHNVNLWHFWCCDIAMILPSIHCNAFPMVPCTLPVFFIVNSQALWFIQSTTLLITQLLGNFVLQLVETAVYFTICMIQHMFSILIYSFNHIFIKLSWIEDKQQQHCFSIEGKNIVCIAYTLSTVILVLLNGKMIANKVEFK